MGLLHAVSHVQILAKVVVYGTVLAGHQGRFGSPILNRNAFY